MSSSVLDTVLITVRKYIKKRQKAREVKWLKVRCRECGFAYFYRCDSLFAKCPRCKDISYFLRNYDILEEIYDR